MSDEQLVEVARLAMAEGAPARAADALRKALALWRGPALGDVAVEGICRSEVAQLEERRITALEERIEAEKGRPLAAAEREMTVHQRESIGFGTIARTVFSRYRRRAVLGFSLFIGQAFLYNAITFGFGAILTTFYDVPTSDTGYYFAVVAAGNLLGPLLLHAVVRPDFWAEVAGDAPPAEQTTAELVQIWLRGMRPDPEPA